jgi:hypothetical protein
MHTNKCMYIQHDFEIQMQTKITVQLSL